MKEFKIHVYLDIAKNSNGKLLTQLCNIVLDSAKGSIGSIGSDHCIHIIHGWGNHSDAVRVYSALINNNYTIVWSEGV